MVLNGCGIIPPIACTSCIVLVKRSGRHDLREVWYYSTWKITPQNSPEELSLSISRVRAKADTSNLLSRLKKPKLLIIYKKVILDMEKEIIKI